MQRLNGAPRRYAWGTADAIPAILGTEPDGKPYAEYWLGAHEIAPARTADGGLDRLLRAHPEVLGTRSLEAFGPQLPFLMKILSARHALSLQAHPTREQAQEGFRRENVAGVPLDAPERVYSDPWPKPEILIALEPFDSLHGFRDPLATAELFAGLGVATQLASVIGPLTERRGPAGLAEVFLDALSLDAERLHLVDVVGSAAIQHVNDPGELGDFARTAVQLDSVFPADRGIIAALLLNHVKMAPGEGCYVRPGQMHAYLSGTGIEVMACSDNVIRGGLTSKHIDVAELVRVVDFTPFEPQVALPVPISPGVEHYPTPCDEFDVWRLLPDDEVGPVPVPGGGSARIVLVIEGAMTVRTGGQELALAQGEAAFLRADEYDATADGAGLAFVTSSGLR